MHSNRLNVAIASFTLLAASAAHAVPVTFNKLAGLTGGTPAATAVYRADLDALGFDIASISIADVSGGFGGAAGQFSGFDLDAILLSTTLCADAACAAGLTGLSVFDYSTAGTIFAPGTQRAPTDPKLFGTDITGTNVDDSIATLGTFDANSTIAIPGADGFVSMGDFGKIAFNLTSLVSSSGLYLYIGEVGDNGEVAASSITVSDRPVATPAPAVAALLGVGLIGFGVRSRLRA